MKKSIFTLLLGAFLFTLSTQSVTATNPISQEVSSEYTADYIIKGEVQKDNVFKRFFKKVRKGVQNFKAKVKATYYAIAAMFDDPVRKWMWLWLLFGLLAVILIVIAFIAGIGTGSSILFRILWYLGWASSLFSSVSFVIWIVKLLQG